MSSAQAPPLRARPTQSGVRRQLARANRMAEINLLRACQRPPGKPSTGGPPRGFLERRNREDFVARPPDFVPRQEDGPIFVGQIVELLQTNCPKKLLPLMRKSTQWAHRSSARPIGRIIIEAAEAVPDGQPGAAASRAEPPKAAYLTSAAIHPKVDIDLCCFRMIPTQIRRRDFRRCAAAQRNWPDAR